MTAKEYLEQVQGIEFRIKALAMQKRRLQNKGWDNKEIIKLEQDIECMRISYINLQKKITKEVHSMKNHVYASLLSAKYLSGATWEEVARLLGYKDEKYVRTVLHSKALKEFSKLPR